MSTKRKGIKVERIVDFIDPEVKFVSLVGHSANRTPFTILKAEGGTSMSKSIVSVLVPKELSDEQAKEVLKEFNDADAKEYDTYIKYPQVDDSIIKNDTCQLVFLDKDTKTMGVIADLVEDEPTDGGESVTKKDPDDPDPAQDDNLDKTKKDAVDYVTIDTMLTEAYAMMDIMMGALQQSGMKANNRKNMITNAVKNFQIFVDTFFENAGEKEAVKSMDIKLLSEMLKDIEDVDDDTNPLSSSSFSTSAPNSMPSAGSAANPDPNTSSKPSEGAPAEGGPDSQKGVSAEDVTSMIEEAIKGIVFPEQDNTKVDELIKSVTESSENTKEVIEDLTAKVDKVIDDMVELQAQPHKSARVKAEDGLLSTYRQKKNDKTTFDGALFRV